MTDPVSNQSASKRPGPIPKWPGASISLDELPLAYIEIDEKGVIRFANEAAYSLHEIPSEELLGREIWDLLPPDEIVRSRAAFFASLASDEEPATVRRSLFNTQGEYRIQEFHRRMLRDADGKAAGISAVVVDVSQMEAAAQIPRQRVLWLESILASLPSAVLVTDLLGFVDYINPAGEKLTGWSAGELTGNPIERVFPESATNTSEAGASAGHSFQAAIGGNCVRSFELKKRDGEQIKVTVTASPVLDKESGYASGLLLSVSLDA